MCICWDLMLTNAIGFMNFVFALNDWQLGFFVMRNKKMHFKREANKGYAASD